MTHRANSRDEMNDVTMRRDGIAIIGMSCLFPGAPDLDAYWRNLLGGVDSISDPPSEAWDPAHHYEPGSSETDRVYCKRGGYIGAMASFDPLVHNIPPIAVGGEPDQWLALQLARDALDDAGYGELDEAVRHRTAVILGKGTYLNGGNSVAIQHGLILSQTLEILRSLHPEYGQAEIETIRNGLKGSLPSMGPEIVPGLIPNVIVGRIANRLDLMGPAYTIDAACASSLVAVQIALRDLRDGECDLAIVGGSQVWIPVPTMNVFCQLGALSHHQQLRPFDKDADGTLLGEGIGMVVLKRLADAERDGDRIYAVVRGVGVASDGRGVGVMAPRIEGEVLALQRAYDAAGVPPETIGLIEAHGTGTQIGDLTEVRSLARVFGPRTGRLPHCALGSVKSMIGHTIPAAGVAGLIKTALALHHKMLPPSLNCEEPNPKLELDQTTFYINTTLRPWIHGGNTPRRAGISAFGFGGINAHAVLEEYQPRRQDSPDSKGSQGGRSTPVEHQPVWDSEVCLLSAESRSALMEKVHHLSEFLDHQTDAPGSFSLSDVAFTLSLERDGSKAGSDEIRLAVVASSLDDLRRKLGRATDRLSDPDCQQIRDISGIYFAAEPLGREGRLAFLFPGEGAQYPNMLADLCLHLPEVRECFDRFDRLFHDLSHEYLPSDYIFPRPALSARERSWTEAQLWSIEGAIESVRVANLALHGILKRLAIRPDIIVGHSSGEYAALQAAGILDLEPEGELLRVTKGVLEVHAAALQEGMPRAVLLALGTGRETAEVIARTSNGRAFVAMDNCPHQVVLACEPNAAPEVIEAAGREGVIAKTLPFDRPYHSPLFASYAEILGQGWIKDQPLTRAHTLVYSCTTASRFPDDPASIRTLLVEHWIRPVEFRKTVEALHDDGVRLFVEVGPRGNLTAFIEDILRDRPFCAVPANVQRRSGIAQLHHLIGLLASHGVGLDTSYLYSHRHPRRIDWSRAAMSDQPRRVAHPMKLRTGFPLMQLPDEVLHQLHKSAEWNFTATSPQQEVPPQSTNGHAHSAPLPPSDTNASRDRVIEGIHHDDVFDRLAPPEATTDPELAMPGTPATNPPGEIPSDGEPFAPLIRDFLSTMQQFLSVQELIVRDCLSPSSTHLEGAAGETSSWPDGAVAIPQQLGPLLGKIVSCTPGRELICRRVFDPREDRYLADHALGQAILSDDPDLTGLIVMPLTMSLEILAEAANCLVPDRLVVGLREVHAHRWIAFDNGPQTLQITAHREPDDPNCIAVILHNMTESGHKDGQHRGPVIEGFVLLADHYPPTPSNQIRIQDKGQPSSLSTEDLYTETMFHGPRWQGVVRTEWTAPCGEVATLRVKAVDDFIRSLEGPRFLLDPVVLDAAGQVVGFWAAEQLSRGRVVFPFRLEALELYGPNRPVGESISCEASIQLVGDQQVRSDIDLNGMQGDPWMRLVGWWDKRFDLPPRFHALLLPGGRSEASEPWPAPAAELSRSHVVECRRIAIDIPSDLAFWKEVWAHRILSVAEREQFRRSSTPLGRQIEWLAGRTAAKEAVRELICRQGGPRLELADIAIEPDAHGQPIVECGWCELRGIRPVVSIAHTSGLAVALAGLATGHEPIPRPGIDVERLRARPPGFAEVAFTDQERLLLQPIPPEHHEEWLLRWWSAKEAATKSLGIGLTIGPRTAVITATDPSTGLVFVRLAERLTELDRDLAGNSLAVSTSRHGDMVVAVTLGEFAEPVMVGTLSAATTPHEFHRGFNE